ncbi:hypothetical protein HGP16_18945 [Rhizobium sp. P40RR-XXII]|nr:hypothetical protein [Rhizobium sp. P40RR-XXII]NLS18633.1 hypothetical protein [Rhizobium sp. P40RR-XXII]
MVSFYGLGAPDRQKVTITVEELFAIASNVDTKSEIKLEARAPSEP